MSQIKKRNEWVVLTFLLVGSCCVVEEKWERMTIMTHIDMYVSQLVAFFVFLVPHYLRQSSQFVSWNRQGNHNLVGPATVQLATTDAALVVHLMKRTGRRSSHACAPILQAVLCDPHYIKAGCAIDDDLIALWELWNGYLPAKSRWDLGGIGMYGGTTTKTAATASTATPTTAQRRGLKTLCKHVLQLELPKCKSLACSDWTTVPLSEAQVYYSARDAWAGAAIAHRLGELDAQNFGYSSIRQRLMTETPLLDLAMTRQQRNRAKQDLGKLLQRYRTPQKSKARRHAIPLRPLPERVKKQVLQLKHVIKTKRMERPRVFQVDHLGIHIDN